MTMDKFDDLLSLPGPVQYQSYLKERLETLSVREGYILAAAVQRAPPRNAEEAVDCLNSLDGYEVCPAGSYEELGAFQFQRLNVPEEVLPHVALDQLGQLYEDEHPGLFIGNCYVTYPKQPSLPARQENGAPILWDNDWSVKLKLASPAIPEGVWLRLPNHDGKLVGESDEVLLVLDELQIKSLEDCTLLEARCILPEAGDLMKQYDSVTELVQDGSNLGYAMEERGQGEPHWLERFAAALEYENCRALRFALDISQNLHCYEWVSGEDLANFAANYLRSEGVPEELIQSGCIDLGGYAEDLLETSGYMQTSGESGYITRNNREFYWEHSPKPADSGMQSML